MAKWIAQRPDIDPTPPLRVIGRLERVFRLVDNSLVRIFKAHGLNNSSFDVLATLRRSGDPFRMTSSELARSTLITNSAVTQRLDKLEAAGLVTREGDPSDRRVVYAQLTPDGLTLIDEVTPSHFENEAHILSGLTGEERHSLAELLDKLEKSIPRPTP